MRFRSRFILGLAWRLGLLLAAVFGFVQTLSVEGLGAARPTAPAPAPAAPAHEDLNLERAEKQMVEQALKKHSYNISLAAAELGLTRASLYRRMEKHGL